MRNVNMVIALAFYLAGTVAYLAISEATMQLQATMVLIQGVLLLSASFVMWGTSLRVPVRLLTTLLVTVLFSGFAIYITSLQVSKINPLEPQVALTAILAYTVETALFLIGTWVIGRGIVFLRERRA